MAGRRVKVEFDDGSGGKYSLSLDGTISKEKVMKVMDLVELLSGNSEDPQFSEQTTVGRLHHLIDKRFPLSHFTSSDILEAYEDEYNQPIRLSTVSTYLYRFSSEGMLRRIKTGVSWSYRRSNLTRSQ